MDMDLGTRIDMRNNILRLFAEGLAYEEDGRLTDLLIDVAYRGLAAAPLLTGNEGADLYRYAKEAAILSGRRVIEFHGVGDDTAPYGIDDQTLGTFMPDSGDIYILVTDSTTNMARTLLHELGHAYSEAALTEYEHLTFATTEQLRHACEVHAEGVAYAILGAFGIDALAKSAAYVASHGVRGVDQDAMSDAIMKTAGEVMRLLSSPSGTRIHHGIHTVNPYLHGVDGYCPEPAQAA